MLRGWRRSLCIYSHVYRGTPDKPGLVLGLDRGGACPGVAFRVEAALHEKTIRYLREREQPTAVYLQRTVPIVLETGERVGALVYVADRLHPQYAGRLTREAERFGENLRVMTVADALYANRADYDGGACIIVSTMQAFRREQTEGLKVYEANGELMDHFTALPDGLRRLLDKGPGGDPVPSLANVLKLRRPVVIVDEAHNAAHRPFFRRASPPCAVPDC